MIVCVINLQIDKIDLIGTTQTLTLLVLIVVKEVTELLYAENHAVTIGLIITTTATMETVI